LRLGKFDKTVWKLILITIIVPVAALIIWVHFLSPNLSRYVGMVPNDPLWMLMFYAIANATFNAALEEITWRGVMLEALDSAFGPGWCALLIQSLSFAVAHYRNGFPNGIVGSAMVVIFGLMTGLIRRKSKGIVAGWLAHAAVDATIFCLILHFMQQSK
jgi:membrane protease YdiL (CAAX protease family)